MEYQFTLGFELTKPSEQKLKRPQEQRKRSLAALIQTFENYHDLDDGESTLSHLVFAA